MSRASTMPRMTVAEKLTADEFLAMADPRRGLELIAGEVVVDEPVPAHQRLVRELLFALCQWTAAGGGRGEASLPLDVKVDARNVFAPDLLWYAEGSGPKDPYQRPSPVPELAVEVRSPSTWRYDLGTKKSTYEAHGLGELWLVDTDRARILVYRRSRPDASRFDIQLELSPDETLTSPLLRDFALPLGDLFAA